MSDSPSFARFRGTETYLTNDSLEAAVNCALVLERPLLVKGEPGTGKTLLAEAIAEGLSMPLIPWHVKSTTRAQDGLYVYDTVQRLYDSRFGDGDVADIRRYIKKGPLGQSFASEERVVLLIDEIDKADVEFPNDLLPRARSDALPGRRDRQDDHRGEAAPRRHHHVATTRRSCRTRSSAAASSTTSIFPTRELMTRIVRVHHPYVHRGPRSSIRRFKVFYESPRDAPSAQAPVARASSSTGSAPFCKSSGVSHGQDWRERLAFLGAHC